MKVCAILLWAAVAWAGSNSAKVECSTCHAGQSHVASAMSRAMELISECRILKSHPEMTFHEGAYSFRIHRAGEEALYTVTDGTETLTVKLKWALGQGAAGQTYVFERNGNYYESRVSYFEDLKGLDVTMGAHNLRPRNLDEAAGRLMGVRETKECINCHATDSVIRGELHPNSLVPGVQCGRCHEGSERHAGAARAGNAGNAAIAKLGKLSTEEMSNYCGQCHRTWEQIAAEGPHNINNVRFQPYRLANSRCYDAADPRIRCTACHDPHGAVAVQASAYDAKCGSCHAAAKNKLCPVGVRDCVTCHMPKYELPGAHHRFTDHQIRIVKANAPYPN